MANRVCTPEEIGLIWGVAMLELNKALENNKWTYRIYKAKREYDEYVRKLEECSINER